MRVGCHRVSTLELKNVGFWLTFAVGNSQQLEVCLPNDKTRQLIIGGSETTDECHLRGRHQVEIYTATVLQIVKSSYLYSLSVSVGGVSVCARLSEFYL